MANENEKDLNFKVDPRLHTAFKVIAADAGISMKDLLEDCLWLWIDHRGGQNTRSDGTSVRNQGVEFRKMIRSILTDRTD